MNIDLGIPVLIRLSVLHAFSSKGEGYGYGKIFPRRARDSFHFSVAFDPISDPQISARDSPIRPPFCQDVPAGGRLDGHLLPRTSRFLPTHLRFRWNLIKETKI